MGILLRRLKAFGRRFPTGNTRDRPTAEAIGTRRLQQTEALRTRGVSLHLLDLGGDIAGNGLSRLFMTIAAAFAELERDRIRERIA